MWMLSVDLTPDKNIDQLSVTVRSWWKPIERFLQFVSIFRHSGQILYNVLLKFFTDKRISLDDCRGQSYDNASNMSGKYNGWQAKLKEQHPLIVHVPCAGHSLNLVGNLKSLLFSFGFIHRLYSFFTHRWTVLTTALGPGLVVRRPIDTRWRRDAMHALFESYIEIKEALSN